MSCSHSATNEECRVYAPLLHLRIFAYGWANISNDTLLAVGTLNRYPSVVFSTLQLVRSACITFAFAHRRVWPGQY